MRLPKGWNQPKRPSETEVLEFLKMGYEASLLTGMPVVICALPPSNKDAVVHAWVRESELNPGVPSATDATYLAASVLARVLSCYPTEESRTPLRRVILELADSLVYERHGGTIPPHMVESDHPPRVMDEDGDAS